MGSATVSRNHWYKVAGWIIAGAFAVAGWIYAGIMSGYTARIVTLETVSELTRTDIRAMQLQQARFEEMFKAMSEKLDIIIEQQKYEARK